MGLYRDYVGLSRRNIIGVYRHNGKEMATTIMGSIDVM